MAWSAWHGVHGTQRHGAEFNTERATGRHIASVGEVKRKQKQFILNDDLRFDLIARIFSECMHENTHFHFTG